ncbi:dihydrofolate reductase family protein [Agromyces sp. NPDC058484]|uniref:dihydrofolate reductase family protein n=1 Tax=Agromyces sp. NPDC058484 TaxID=3346524 RepID=UPI00366A00C6
MSNVFLEMTMTLDGFTAGPGVSLEHPLGIGGERVHAWLSDIAAAEFELGPPHPGYGAEGAMDAAPDEVDRSAAARMFEMTGAFVLGRRTFDVGAGPWGDDGAFEGRPCFVVTSRSREPVERGGSRFEFVTDGVAEAIVRARAAASAASVCILGGAEVARQALVSGLVDEVRLHLVPVLLGGGTRPFPDSAPRPIELEPLAVEQGALATHVRYRVLRPA